MERFVIVMPVNTSAYLLPCDDGDTCKLETLQKLVGGPIEMADTCLAASWAREDVDSIQMAVNEEGLLQELPYNEHATDLYAFNYMLLVMVPASSVSVALAWVGSMNSAESPTKASTVSFSTTWAL